MSEEPNELTNIEREHIAFIKENLRFKRDLAYYSNFAIYMVPAFLIFVGLMIFYFGRIKHSSDTHIGNFLPMLVITAGVTLAVFFQKRIKESESFELIPITKWDVAAIEKQIKSKLKVNEIVFDESLEILTAQTKLNILSWGENITIIKADKNLLINSRSSGTRQPIMLFKNRKNMDLVKTIIQETCC